MCPQGSDCREDADCGQAGGGSRELLGWEGLGKDWTGEAEVLPRLSSHRREEEGVMGSKAIV